MASLPVQFRSLRKDSISGCPLIKSFTTTIEAGSHVCFIGPKVETTALLELVSGLQDPTSGSIRVGTSQVAGTSSELLQMQLGVLQENPWLTQDSLLKNVSPAGFTRRNRTKVTKAIELAQVQRIARKMPQGLATPVISHAQLSLLERRQIALAKVLANDPKVLLLERPLSGLTNDEAKIFSSVLADASQGRTVLTFSQNYKNARRAQQVFIIDQGTILCSTSTASVYSQGTIHKFMDDCTAQPSSATDTWNFQPGVETITGYVTSHLHSRRNGIETWVAWSTAEKTDVKIRLPKQQPTNKSVLQHLENEFHALQNVTSQLLPQPLKKSLLHDIPYTVFESVKGETLASTLRQLHCGLSLPELLRLSSDIARALFQLHSQSFAHLDLNPRCIRIEAGQNRISSARFITKCGRKIDDLVVESEPFFQAPERIPGSKALAASDIFSLGRLLYRCAAGPVPFTRKNQPPQHNLTFFLPQVPPSFAELVEQMMDVDWRQRPTIQNIIATINTLKPNEILLEDATMVDVTQPKVHSSSDF